MGWSAYIYISCLPRYHLYHRAHAHVCVRERVCVCASVCVLVCVTYVSGHEIRSIFGVLPPYIIIVYFIIEEINRLGIYEQHPRDS